MADTKGRPTGNDPALLMRFAIEIDGRKVEAFTGCEGLNAEVTVVEYTEGGNNVYKVRLPGQMFYTNVKLTRPLDSDSRAGESLYAWLAEQAKTKTVVKRTAKITAYDGNFGSGKPIATWKLAGVWPVKYTGPIFTADGTTAAEETIEFAHDGFLVEV